MNKDLITIADHFGHATQLSKQSEESRELTEATDEYHQCLVIEDDPEELKRKRAHMIEEMADTHIVMQQIIYQENAQAEFDAMVKAKIERTLKRIKEGFYGN